MLLELKEILEQSKESCNKLRQQNSDLLQEAEAATSELKSKLRNIHHEVEEKNEIIVELKEMLDQGKETCNKLRQENLDLVQEARSAKALRDEIDFLNERVRKLDRLESEVQRYKDRLSDMEFLKSRIDEVREENHLLTESKFMLQEQLDSVRKRCERVPDLEHQVIQLKALSLELESQQQLDKEKTACLVDEVNQLRIEKKAAVEELNQTQTELKYMRNQVKSLNCNTGASNLLEQLKNDSSTRLLKLELENQKLLCLVDNMNGKSSSSTCSSLSSSTSSHASPSSSSCSELRNIHHEVEEKNEIIVELKEMLDQGKETCNKLRQENLDLVQEARSAKALRDEIDFLNERVRKMDLLESEVQRYKDRLRDMESLKSRIDEVREENHRLTESKFMLQEQLDSVRKRCERVPDLEHQVIQLKALSLELESQQQLDKEKTACLVDEVNQLRIEKKAAVEELNQTQTELKCMRNQGKSLNCNTGASNLLEQLKNDASARLLKLELENQKLLSLVNNMNGKPSSSTYYRYHYHHLHLHAVSAHTHSTGASINSNNASFVTVIDESEDNSGSGGHNSASGPQSSGGPNSGSSNFVNSHRRHSMRRIGSGATGVSKNAPRTISPTPSTVGGDSVWYEYGCV